MTKMFVIYIKYLYLINLIRVQGLFVEVGNYPDHLKYGINTEECGLGFVPKTVVIFYSKNCFLKNFGNKSFTYVFTKPNNTRRGKVSNRIFNGRDALDGESPWTVRLEFHIELSNSLVPILVSDKRCTGSLLTLKWVLTAAHCVSTPGIVQINIFAGATDVRRPVLLSNIFKHPLYETKDGNKYDIALIKLEESFERNKDDQAYYLNTVCLPNEVQQNDTEESATMSGWGAIDERGTKPKTLQIAETRLIPGKQCSNREMLCAKMISDDPRPCVGDSGGPLVQYSSEELSKAIQIGVLRGGTLECKAGTGYRSWCPPMKVINWLLNTIVNN